MYCCYVIYERKKRKNLKSASFVHLFAGTSRPAQAVGEGREADKLQVGGAAPREEEERSAREGDQGAEEQGGGSAQVAAEHRGRGL